MKKLKQWWIFNVYPFNFFTRLGRKWQREELERQGYQITSSTVSTSSPISNPRKKRK